MRFSQFGTDPFVTMNIGISQFFRVDFGFIQMLSNLVLLAVMAKSTPKLIHLGTVLGIVVVGYLSDFFLDFLFFLKILDGDFSRWRSDYSFAVSE